LSVSHTEMQYATFVCSVFCESSHHYTSNEQLDCRCRNDCVGNVI